MNMNELKGVTEGLLFASGDEGVTLKQLSKILDIGVDTVEHLLEELRFEYEREDRGLMIIQSNDILHLTTKPEHSSYFKRLIDSPRTSKMSQAALETLAIIAYRQPITRAEIDEIRGVRSERPLQTLITRSLIEESGRKDTVGRPVLFQTSKEFLTFFGLASLDELPPLPENIDPDKEEREADLFFERFQDEV
ncbi:MULTISPECIES: SMC-Scp complex subunit ScpB [Oceanobacillus]|uniref:Segregation and condensation protein B n=1 Tax=Oceanobacillus kimchii TaxID=746691 RepID=A0ABQ5TJY7_9BACI|nr:MULTISPECIES: SMC-Scp complex subunit ScpB [Oceanobacillus]MBT2598421.1 SMC-Scp complex subunit ScpB [Oceanobacillus sp. ISL-74]MBT2651339.1 SMC-Scp complex subunit ScpB [Oceanobacillus sp. ISL-73]OEH55735.1 segregation and condensation protein B [Oceanobacillus sp. E9]GLO66482.1 segregation and condensation protein B [Oceanobacillus kimchii]